MAQWIRRRPSKSKIAGSSPAGGSLLTVSTRRFLEEPDGLYAVEDSVRVFNFSLFAKQKIISNYYIFPGNSDSRIACKAFGKQHCVMNGLSKYLMQERVSIPCEVV